MEGSFLLPALVLVPLIGAIITLFMGGKRQKYAKYTAFVTTLVILAIAVVLLLADDLSAYDFSANWIDTAGVKMNLIFRVDGLSILMVFLTSVLVPLALVFSYKEGDRPNYFYTLLLAIEFGLLGVYTSADYFLFYIMWEVTLIPFYFLISWYGGPRRHYAAIKFLIYTHVASLVMLIGFFALGFEAAAINGAGVNFSFDYINSAVGGFGEVFQTLVFGLLFFGFAVKMPAVPFHTWLPDAHTEAPTAGSVLLAGVMLKMGSYGIIRICLENLPLGAVNWQNVMIFIGVLSMIYGAYACIAQRDLKKMVAYSSISHMGLVMVSMGCLSDIGIEFAIFQMFAHGLISAMLFMVCGWAGHSVGTREIPLLGGLAGKLPYFATFMMFAFMASLGLPGLIGFWGEFGIVYAFYEWMVANNVIYLLVLPLLSLLLTAGYYLWAMQRTLFGKLTDRIDLSKAHDMDRIEAIVLGALAFLVAIYGFWPDLALHYIDLYAIGFFGVI
ncbi:MAG: NADH-quinone oxidoreductase subunit M [Candidatus Methanomethylophilus sp.]|nr:NADH-quinone oxidoreductase subunit M [Methanomethylophilus sp.]MDD3233086.1 NADH-quinone oxidoreductase subunit M [Methanomethylophilus sp.]MDD4221930.1 NADH-quinone oxidoreductase subunit M [Methanomethylophilus sp.]